MINRIRDKDTTEIKQTNHRQTSSSSSFFLRFPLVSLLGEEFGVTFSFLTLLDDGVTDSFLDELLLLGVVAVGLTSDFFSFFTFVVEFDFRCAAAACFFAFFA